MKMNLFKIIALTLVILMIATACAPANVPSDSDAVDPTTTEPEMTEGDTSEEVTTEAPVVEEKKVKNILMIGNSFCYYYVEELCGIAAADGYDLNVANLYASGAWLNEHWKNYLSDEDFYDFT